MAVVRLFDRHGSDIEHLLGLLFIRIPQTELIITQQKLVNLQDNLLDLQKENL